MPPLPSLWKNVSAVVVLLMLAACASMSPRTVEVTATIVEREGATIGSLVKLAFEPDSAMPTVGQKGTLRTVPEKQNVTLFGKELSTTISYGAGECEVVSTSDNSAVVRITKEGSSAKVGEGDPSYVLPEVGSQVILEWLQQPDET